MDRLPPTIIVIAFIGVLLFLMWRGWRSRAKRQVGYSAPLTVPPSIGADLATARALYLSTTKAGKPLERLVVSGLGFRSQSDIQVTESGIVIHLTGEQALFIPANHVLSLDAATITIDRVVEKDGLVRLSWLLGEDAVDSYFRLADEHDRRRLFDAIRRIAPQSPASAA